MIVRRGAVMGERRLVWDRPEPGRRVAPAPLSRARIVATAIEVADAEGLPAVTLRRVAAELGGGPMRLYRFVESKDELLDLMVDAAYGEIDVGPPAGDWRAGLRAIANNTQAVAVRHPWLVGLLGAHPPYGPNGLRLTEHALAVLAGRGLDAATITRAVSAVFAYVIGYVQLEFLPMRAGPAGRGAPSPDEVAGYLQRIAATGDYPTLARVFTELGQPDVQEAFAAGLDYVLDGIAGQIGQRG
jgi:AcrR family transcriptional regulator